MRECAWHLRNAIQSLWERSYEKVFLTGIQDFTEPMKMLRSAESGALRYTYKYQSYGCATKFRQRNSYMQRKRPELWPTNWILCHDNAPAHKAPSVKQFLAQKFITEMEQSPYFLDLALNDF
jgi:hypothetical protein